MKDRKHATGSSQKNHSESHLPLFLSLVEIEPEAAEQVAGLQPSMSSVERRELANKVPFFLRLWWLREDFANEHLIRLGNQAFTTPVGTPYSDPLCDAGSADLSR